MWSSIAKDSYLLIRIISLCSSLQRYNIFMDSCRKIKIVKRSWSLLTFLYEAIGIYGNLFDYGRIEEVENWGRNSNIPVRCNSCLWSGVVCLWDHIMEKEGCLRCGLKEDPGIGWPKKIGKYTYIIFLQRAIQVHGKKYDYSKVKKEDIINAYTKIPITCAVCLYFWRSTNIHDHLNNRGCPDCAGNIPWTLNRFLEKARIIHGDIYDYSMIKEEHIQGRDSKISIICTICKNMWNTCSINHHINSRSRCPECANRIPWSLRKFLKRAVEVHGNIYDYSMIKEEHIQGKNSKISIICTICKNMWNTCSINNHINNKSGCPICSSSKGELECFNVFQRRNVKIEREYTILYLSRKKFDFFFIVQDRKFLLEYDGIQHFEQWVSFSKNKTPEERKELFEKRQQVDILKTQKALEEGYTLIRIDYTQIDNIECHITAGINSSDNLYLSTPEMYEYITFNL